MPSRGPTLIKKADAQPVKYHKTPIINFKQRPLHIQLLIILVAVKFVVFSLAHISNYFVPANNHSGDLILATDSSLNGFDGALKMFLVPFIRWDAVHLLSIARHGYIFENQFAFFPLLHMTCRYLALGVLKLGLQGILSPEVLISLLAISISNSCHYFSALILFKLTNSLFKSSKYALVTAIIFIFNPAIMQLSTMYTEAPFAFFCFSGLLFFHSGQKFLAALSWALASLTRSNGIVMIGFFFYDLMKTTFKKPDGKIRFLVILKCFLLTIIYSAITVSGFVGFQVFAFRKFCTNPKSLRPWCTDRIPNVYSFVQKTYWNVGFLNYFKVSQIPNFLIALPMIIICASAVYIYFDADHLRFLSADLLHSKKRKEKSLEFFLSDIIIPHVYLLLFMLMYTTLFAHVQIITRLFTFMPLVYWFMAHVMLNAEPRIQRALQSFIALYGMLGTVLFSTNYPPA